MSDDHFRDEAAKINDELRKHPLRVALPTGRARRLYTRLANILDKDEAWVEEIMTERQEALDEAARKTEHEE